MKIPSNKRPMFRFWLRRETDYENEVIWIIEHIPDRSWSRFIRDAIRLLYDLRYARRTVVLQELFPDIADRMGASANLVKSMKSLEKSVQRIDIDALFDQFEEMKKVLKETPVTMQSVGLKPMNVPQIAMPIISDSDDDLPLVVLNKDKNASKKLSSNFMDSVLGLQQGGNK